MQGTQRPDDIVPSLVQQFCIIILFQYALLLYISLEEVVLAGSTIDVIEGVKLERFGRQSNAFGVQVHMQCEPALQEQFGLRSLAELQALNSGKVVDLCQEGWYVRHILNNEVRLTLFK